MPHEGAAFTKSFVCKFHCRLLSYFPSQSNCTARVLWIERRRESLCHHVLCCPPCLSSLAAVAIDVGCAIAFRRSDRRRWPTGICLGALQAWSNRSALAPLRGYERESTPMEGQRRLTQWTFCGKHCLQGLLFGSHCDSTTAWSTSTCAASKQTTDAPASSRMLCYTENLQRGFPQVW